MGTELKESKFIIYNDGSDVKVNVLFDSENETIWLNQKQLAELFDSSLSNISEHISNIYKTKELQESDTFREFRNVSNQRVKHYNLDMIIAVGYRVNSIKATNFRKWSNDILKEFIVKGFVIDSDRLKNGKHFGKDYFDELLEVIREIRASEKRYYQKITDIYERCSIDYNKDSDVTRKFFMSLQNKLHYAITGLTAPEIIASRVDVAKNNMGLATWKHSPDALKIFQKDVIIAKNYLIQDEIKKLERLSVMYLDYAENQVEMQDGEFTMQGWIDKLDSFLAFNGYKVLKGFGNVKKVNADNKAINIYKTFKKELVNSSKNDYDTELENIEKDIKKLK